MHHHAGSAQINISKLKTNSKRCLNKGPSSSPYASLLHMVPKDTHTWRLCGDFRRLNAQTTPDKYPVPHLHDLAMGLKDMKIFTKLDLVKAYYQIPVAEEDIAKTAMTTPFGLYEFTRMPFAAQTFHRLIDEVLRGLPFVFAYIDDVGSSPVRMTRSIDNTSNKYLNAYYGLKINPVKNVFSPRRSCTSWDT